MMRKASGRFFFLWRPQPATRFSSRERTAAARIEQAIGDWLGRMGHSWAFFVVTTRRLPWRESIKGPFTVNDLSQGIKAVHAPTPTLKSVRRMPNLIKALSEVNRRPVGCDGIRWEGFGEPLAYLRWNPNFLDLFPDLQPLKNLQERIAYSEEPDPAEEVVVDRGRVVQRSTVADRIIQRTVARKLRLSFDRFLAPGCWGYRPGRSTEQAIVEVRSCIRAGAHWAFKTDVENFFPSVDRAILYAQLRATIPDQDLCDFLMKMISPVLLSRKSSVFQVAGLPQGNGITPFLANFYLHGLDIALAELKYFRYVDDILVLGRTRQEVLQAQHRIQELLGQLHLQLNNQKTYVRDLYRQSVTYLGYEIRGGNLYPPEKAITRFKQELQGRGQEDRKNLMDSFVRRFRVGPVRKLFRRLDRDLIQLYPPGLTLVGLLEKGVGSV